MADNKCRRLARRLLLSVWLKEAYQEMHMRLSRWIKDPFCGLSHWFGAGLSVAGLVFLLLMSKGPGWHAAVLALYGTSLIVLYVSSALAHSVKCSQRLEDRLTRLDYAAIFLLIAGTYTPVCTIAVGGAW